MTNPIRILNFRRFTARLIVLVSFATLLPAARAQVAPTLGTAKSFAVLAAAAVSNTGSSTVYGDLGLSPNDPSSITGISGLPTPGQVVAPGTIHGADSVSLQARGDLNAAYIALGTQGSTANLTGTNLGNRTLTAGVYDYDSSAGLTGTLTLNGTADSVFIFRMGSTLTTASSSSVKLTGGAQSCNVFWKVGSSATLGTATSFIGNILANTSITLTTGATVNGRVLAGAETLSGAVTLDTNNIFFSACATGSTNPDTGPIAGSGPGPTGTPNTPPVSASPCVPIEVTKPQISVTAQLGPPIVYFYRIQDTGSGLASIFVRDHVNLAISTQPFILGATGPVVVTATTIDPSLATGFFVIATDVCGNIAKYDPVGLTLTKTRGRTDPVTVNGIPREEHFIDVMNSRPGLDWLRITVNGREVWSERLNPGQKETINIGRAMNRGDNNTITFEFRGQLGDSAGVLIRPDNDD